MSALRPGIDRPLRLGTRRSPLAMAQAEEARARLIAAHGWAADAVELVPVLATGDKVQDRALAEIGGKALWTKELDAALGEALIDAAVHSMKDVETIRPDVFALAAVLPREDPRDRLIGAESLAALKPGARVGTSSPRRRAQLLAVRPDLEVVLLRGNVQRRLAAVEAGEVDATLLAAAGLNRLRMQSVGAALDDLLPCAAQGAIGIECRADDAATRQALVVIGCRDSAHEVLAERAVLAALGADCHSAIAILARFAGDAGRIDAALYSEDGAETVIGCAALKGGNTDPARALARDLLERASPGLGSLFSP